MRPGWTGRVDDCNGLDHFAGADETDLIEGIEKWKLKKLGLVK